jgi:hypothetical protein
MFASSDGSLDVTVNPGTLTQAQLPLRRRGHPAGLGENTQRLVLLKQAKQRVTACLCWNARKLGGEYNVRYRDCGRASGGAIAAVRPSNSTREVGWLGRGEGLGGGWGAF